MLGLSASYYSTSSEMILFSGSLGEDLSRWKYRVSFPSPFNYPLPRSFCSFYLLLCHLKVERNSQRASERERERLSEKGRERLSEGGGESKSCSLGVLITFSYFLFHFARHKLRPVTHDQILFHFNTHQCWRKLREWNSGRSNKRLFLRRNNYLWKWNSSWKGEREEDVFDDPYINSSYKILSILPFTFHCSLFSTSTHFHAAHSAITPMFSIYSETLKV